MMRTFSKQISNLIGLLVAIRLRIQAWNVPRLRICKERMELGVELEEGEEFPAGKKSM